MRSPLPFAVALVLVAACAGPQSSPAQPLVPLPVVAMPELPADPAPRTDAPAVLITNATIMTAAGDTFAPGYLLMQAGRILAVAAGPPPQKLPADTRVIDATDRFVTPGLIDPHSHLGLYPLPRGEGHLDGNEIGVPITAEVWAEHAFATQDPGLWRAVSGGITTIHVLPGSANLIGGRSLTAKLIPETSARAMRFPGAPQGVKMACGENPKRTYGDKGGPHTRMGNVARLRGEFVRALEYQRSWQRYTRDLARWRDRGGVDDEDEPADPPDPPARDLGLDTLVGILEGRLLVHPHCYRADDMHVMLDLAKELGFEIRTFHHGLEAYKLADRLAREKVGVATWADWWGFKLEAYDGIPQNVAILAAAGGRPMMHSDSPAEIRQLNQEAAKARTAGRLLGLDTNDDAVLRWITANPAWALGISQQTGTLEAGKMADLVIWDGYPFSVYTRASKVFIDGHLIFDRGRPARRADFELGQPGSRGETP